MEFFSICKITGVDNVKISTDFHRYYIQVQLHNRKAFYYEIATDMSEKQIKKAIAMISENVKERINENL